MRLSLCVSQLTSTLYLFMCDRILLVLQTGLGDERVSTFMQVVQLVYAIDVRH